MSKQIIQRSKGCKAFHRKSRKPAQQRYVSAGVRWINKRRKAQKEANRTRHAVKIKVNGVIEIIHPNRSI